MTSEKPFRVFLVDDKRDLVEGATEVLEDHFANRIFLETETSFDKALLRLEHEAWDLVVLDVLGPGDDGAEETLGKSIYQRITEVRWVPVVFYSARPSDVRDLENPPLVQVVKKGPRFDELLGAIESGLASGAPALTRTLAQSVDIQVRNFLRDVIAPNWTEMGSAQPDELSVIVLHRLAAWLREQAVLELSKYLTSQAGESLHQAPAAQTYLYPPVSPHLTAGDLVSNDGELWIVLTPACDLFVSDDPASPEGLRTPKAEFVRLAPLRPLNGHPFLGSRMKERVQEALAGSGRYRYLPKFLEIPESLMDQQAIQAVPFEEIKNYRRIATLDSPWAENFLTVAANYNGRIGISAFDKKEIIGRFS